MVTTAGFNRRGFLALAAAATLDPERLLWIPGRRMISIPKPKPTAAMVIVWNNGRSCDEYPMWLDSSILRPVLEGGLTDWWRAAQGKVVSKNVAQAAQLMMDRKQLFFPLVRQPRDSEGNPINPAWSSRTVRIYDCGNSHYASYVEWPEGR